MAVLCREPGRCGGGRSASSSSRKSRHGGCKAPRRRPGATLPEGLDGRLSAPHPLSGSRPLMPPRQTHRLITAMGRDWARARAAAGSSAKAARKTRGGNRRFPAAFDKALVGVALCRISPHAVADPAGLGPEHELLVRLDQPGFTGPAHFAIDLHGVGERPTARHSVRIGLRDNHAHAIARSDDVRGQRGNGLTTGLSTERATSRISEPGWGLGGSSRPDTRR